VAKLRVNAADTTTTTKYGGLGIGSEMSRLSASEVNPVKDFELSINGKFIGKIYYDYKYDVVNGYYIKLFKFNDEIVKIDATVTPAVGVVMVN